MEKGWPPLYHGDKRGRVRVWVVRVLVDGTVVMEHGLRGGVLQQEIRCGMVFPKNHEWAQSRWVHKRDREGYTEDSSGQSSARITPMLAKTFQVAKPGMFPVYVQPKLDGIRCMASLGPDGSVLLTSRTGMILESRCLDGAREMLQPFFGTTDMMMMDGELYHPEIPFEVLSGMCRRHAGDEHVAGNVRFYLFDVFFRESPGLSFHERLERMTRLGYPFTVPTVSVSSIDGLMEMHKQWTCDGERAYEGIMVRSYDGKYEPGYRSDSLLKYKSFCEDEFEITGYTHGQGRDTGTVIYICQTKDRQHTFRVRPRGTKKSRGDLLMDAPNVIGKRLTVVYQELSADGIPRFPVGKSIRESL